MPKKGDFIPLEKRFLSKVRKTRGCWKWLAHRSRIGYGIMYGENKTELAHRVSWKLSFGKIPEGKKVLHKCDNRACVNPAHLFLGTQLENVRDMIRKNRLYHGFRKGQCSPLSKLDNAQIKKIRSMLDRGVVQRVIGNKFKISQSQISKIKTKTNWGHI